MESNEGTGYRPVVPRSGSYYIRGSEATSALVKVYGISGVSSIDHHLATKEAREQGCMPAGTVIVYKVLDQEEGFYNRLITDEEAEEIRSGQCVIR